MSDFYEVKNELNVLIAKECKKADKDRKLTLEQKEKVKEIIKSQKIPFAEARKIL